MFRESQFTPHDWGSVVPLPVDMDGDPVMTFRRPQPWSRLLMQGSPSLIQRTYMGWVLLKKFLGQC